MKSDSSTGQANRHQGHRAGAARALRDCSWLAAIAAPAVVAAMIASNPLPVLSQAVDLVVVDVATVAKGYRASKLIGSGVVNDKDERIGTLDDIVIGADRALFAVLQVGGFLGVGGQLVAVPYQSLVLDESGSKIVLPGATKDALKKLPEFRHRV
jgi:sporulation protein YlmC with PRC-barrel domain